MTLREPWERARRVLVVRLDNAGDVVLLRPALQAFAEALPDAQFTLLASPGGAQAAPLVPEVDDVIVHRAVWQQLRAGVVESADEHALIQQLREGGFDAALVFTSFSQAADAAGYACFLAGIPLRAGFGTQFAGQVFTDQVPAPPDSLHQAERNLRLIEGLGVPVRDRALRLVPTDEAHAEAAEVLASAGLGEGHPYVVLAPGASAPARRYPAIAFQVVARGIRHATGLPVLVAGSEAERSLVEEVAGTDVPEVIAVAGRTSLPGLAALIERSSVVVANNSLSMHLAEGLGIPSVIAYSGTDPHGRWAPRRTVAHLLSREVECAPCFAIDCPYGMECLDVPPTEMVRAAVRLLEGPSAGRAGRGAA